MSSKLRIKQRSPAPTPLRTPTTPSQFFPPSYFAAAAGVVYPPNRDDDGAHANSFSSNAAHLLPECLPHANTNTSSPRRRSQLGGLDLIECQLLPTLSDTIERMTRPPSQIIPTNSFHLPPNGIMRTPSTSSQSSAVRTQLHTAGTSTTQVPAKQPPMLLRSSGCPEQLPPPPSPRPSSSRVNPKSILKSHTLSEPHLQVRQPHLEDIHQPVHTPSPSLIPCSIPIPPEPVLSESKREHGARPTPISPKPKVEGLVRTGRARSRTDPGTLPKGSPSTRGGNAPPSNPTLVHSGIPRRVGIPPSPVPLRTSAVAPTWHGGLEALATQREKRRLFVTNVEIPSSSSESQTPLTRYVKLKSLSRTDTQSSVDGQLRPPRFGLGLGLSGIHEPKHAVKASLGQKRIAKNSNDQPQLRHAKPTIHRRNPCDEMATPKRRDRSPVRNGHIGSVDGPRRQRELLSRVPADVHDLSGCDTQSSGSEDPCIVSEGSGNSLRSGFDDSGSEYSPVEDDDQTGPFSSTRWETKLQQVRSKARPGHTRLLRGDSELVDEQYTPRASSTSSFSRQSKSQKRDHLIHNEESLETGSSTLASDEDASSIHETPTLAVSERYSSELSRIMAVSSAAAARQREAFGISTSLDLEDYHRVDSSVIPHADSDASLAGSHLWQDECDELATDSLLRRLDQRCSGKYDATRSSMGGNSLSSAPTESSVSQVSIYSVPGSPTRRSSRGVVPKSPPPVPTVREQQWQFLERHILESYGEAEARRQRFIWEFTELEVDFVARLQNMIQLFILPLRLFDWLDDIVRVHSWLSSTLASRQIVDHPRLQMISEVFRAFVPRLETYQPYLVKLEFTASVIDSLTHEGKNDFGEFIKLQEASERCQGWSLEKYLIEPVNRLAQYLDVFRKLLQLTPKSHPDYMSTFALFHTAKLTIRVLSEVKDREDAYEFVKMACSGIRGIASVHLVHRERRLLIQGSLMCVQVSNDEQASSLEPPALADGQGNFSSDVPPGPRPRRAAKLAKAVNVWRGRSNSIKSVASTVVSFSTAPSSFDVHVEQPDVPRTPVVRVESEPIEVEALVFSDLVLLASRIGPSSDGDETWELEPLESFGLSRIVSVLDEIDDRACITLDLAPLALHDLEQGFVSSMGPVVTISLSLAQSSSTPAQGEHVVSLGSWLEPLRRCCQYTLRAVSSLSTTSALAHRAESTAADAVARKPVLSLVAAGMPLPKSPSMQIEESERGVAGDSERQEREERGWWSKRFHEVFVELRERDGGR